MNPRVLAARLFSNRCGESTICQRERSRGGSTRGARFRELYAMLGLLAEVHADGTLDITVGATGDSTKGVIPWNGSSSSFVAGHKNLALHVRLGPHGAATV